MSQTSRDQPALCEVTSERPLREDTRALTRERAPCSPVREKNEEELRSRGLNNYLMSESAAMGEAETSPGLL